MRTTLFSIAAGASLLCGTIAAQAMPAGAVARDGAHAGVILVAGGCGFGFHPGYYGVCRPNGGFYGRPYVGYARPYGFGYGRPYYRGYYRHF